MEALRDIITHRNFPLWVFFAFLVLVPLLFIREFYLQFHSHFTGAVAFSMIKLQWHIVAINIVLFLSFLIPLSFRRKISWKEYGLVTAFFVSLFVEMYGIPLTVFFASRYIYGGGGEMPASAYHFSFLGVDISMTIGMIYGTILMILGMAFIIIGWITLYKNLKDNELVTSGIYSYSRHPQYFGFILIIIGWLIGWPTILTVIFAPILIFIYVRVSRKEERELKEVEGYRAYKKEVPFFI